MLLCWSGGVLECWSVGWSVGVLDVLECCSVGVMGCCKVGLWEG